MMPFLENSSFVLLCTYFDKLYAPGRSIYVLLKNDLLIASFSMKCFGLFFLDAEENGSAGF